MMKVFFTIIGTVTLIAVSRIVKSRSLTDAEQISPVYGIDISYPMHRIPKGNESSQLLGNRQEFYENYMQGCRDHWKDKGHICDSVENDRIKQNVMQTRSMVNFTETGFKKMRAPEALYNLLREFWEKNRGNEREERWFTGNIYTNYWDSPSYMVDIHDVKNEGGGDLLSETVANVTREIIEEWTGNNLSSTSVYGIRVYKRGAVLAPHVDRLPLISSAIINIDQDVNDPWPLEVIGHDNVARNITMEPGDLVLYESHSIIHGRPFPLNGSFFANVFIHFQPTPSQDVEMNEDKNDRSLPIYVARTTEAEDWYRTEVLDSDSDIIDSDETEDEEDFGRDEESGENESDGTEDEEAFGQEEESGENEDQDEYYGYDEDRNSEVIEGNTDYEGIVNDDSMDDYSMLEEEASMSDDANSEEITDDEQQIESYEYDYEEGSEVVHDYNDFDEPNESQVSEDDDEEEEEEEDDDEKEEEKNDEHEESNIHEELIYEYSDEEENGNYIDLSMVEDFDEVEHGNQDSISGGIKGDQGVDEDLSDRVAIEKNLVEEERSNLLHNEL